MKRNRFLPAALSLFLAAALSTGVLAADRTEEETASAYLSEQGIMVGDQNGWTPVLPGQSSPPY